MASETTVQSSCVEEDKADECSENIPPEVQVEDVETYSSIHPGGENGHLIQACNFSTPSSCGRVKTKPWLSGVPSALTPIIKNLDIANKCSSPDAFRHGNKPHPAVCPSPCGKTSQHPNKVLSIIDRKTPNDWLQDECLPEITMDDTYDCTMATDISVRPSSMPSTPVTPGLLPSRSPQQQSQLATSIDLNTTAEIPLNITQDLELPDVNDLKPEHQATDQVSKSTPETSSTCDAQALDRHSPNKSKDNSEVHLPELAADPNRTTDVSMLDVPENIDAPLRWLDQRLFPEITLLDVTRENDPPVAERHSVHSVQVLQDTGLGGQNSSTLNGDASSGTTMNSSAEQSDKCPDECTPKASLKLTQDISMGSALDDSQHSLESSEQNAAKVQTSAETSHAPHPANVTHDLNLTRDVSIHDANVPCNSSPKNLTTELQNEPSETSNTVEAANDELLTKSPGNISKPSPKLPRSLNSTFERNSTRTSCGSSVSGEVGAGTFCIPNKTFDNTPASKENATITLSSSNDWPQRTFDKLSTPSASNTPLTPQVKDSTSESQPFKCPKPDTTIHEEPEVQMVGGQVLNKTEDYSQPELPSTDPCISGTNKELNTLNLDDTIFPDLDCMITSTPMPYCKTQPAVVLEQVKAPGAQKKLYGEAHKGLSGQAPADAPSNIVADRKTFLSRPTPGSFVPPSKPASQLLMYKRTSLLPSRFVPPTSGLPMTRQRSQAMMRQKPPPKTAAAPASASAAPQETTGIPSSYNLRSSLQGPKPSGLGLQKPQSSGIQRPNLRPPTTRSIGPASTSTDKLRGLTATNPATKCLPSTKHPLSGGETLPVAKKKKMDSSVSPGVPEHSASSSVAPNGARNLKQPTSSLRALPAKRGDVGASTSSTEKSLSSSALNKAKPPKQPVSSRKSAMPKSPGSGCANCVLLEKKLEMKSAEMKSLEEECPKCVLLEQQLETKSAEIKRLEEELLKYRSPVEEES